jgi:hypothetical protein
MGYISPFTGPIMSWLGQFLSLPTIILFGISLVVFVTGLVLYLTSTDFDLKDILNLLPRTIVSVRKKIDKRRVGALFLLILGFLMLFTFSDQIMVQAQNPSGGGGPAVYPCGIFLCSTPGNSGPTPSSCPSSPTSPCWTLVQSGIVPISVSNGFGTLTQSYSPPYTVNPFIAPTSIKTNPSAASTTTPTMNVMIVPQNTTLCSGAICGGLSIVGLNNWDNVPAVKTEIFGGANDIYYRQTIDLSDASTFRFGVDCASGSASATAIFRIEYSIDAATSWHTMGSSQDVKMDVADCTGPSGGNSGYGSNTYTALPVNSTTTTTLLRVVGINGNGAGDNVLFGRIWADFQLNIAGLTGYQTCITFAIPSGTPKLNEIIRVYCATSFSGTVSVEWWAGIAG